MTWREGEQVGNYKLGEMLGQGGMATVYKAYHEALDRHVAIKVMHQTFLDDDSFIMRFRREAQLVAKLSHPHIVPIYDFGQHERQPYLVMKYLEGETLKQRLIRQALTLPEILDVMTAVGSALEYAHKQDILHRDIKPSNIVIDADNTPYLTDFGLARLASSGESTMSADMLLGTPHYISPEQAQGKKNLDGRADIYSLGVVLYELLVGHVPFTADTPYAIIHDHIYTPLPPPSQINPDIPLPVEMVLLQVLEKDREDRHSTANELVKDLRDAIEEANLTKLDPQRVSSAAVSLAKLREEWEEEGTPSLSRTPAVQRTAAINTPLQTPTGSKIKTATLVPSQPKKWYQDQRIWPISGCASFLIIAFLMLAILLNMSTNIIALMPHLAEDEDFMAGFEEGRRTGEIRPEFIDIGVRYDPQEPAYIIPTVSTREAERLLEDFPENPLAYLVAAQSLWEDDEELGRQALLQGLTYANEASLYFASATPIADEAGDSEAAVLLAILALDSALQDNDMALFDRLRPTAGHYIYENADALSDIDIVEVLGELEAAGIVRYRDFTSLEESPATRFAVAQNQLLEDNTRVARVTLRDIEEDNPLRAEFILLQAELQIALENPERASEILDVILNSRLDVPQWVRETADEIQADINPQ